MLTSFGMYKAREKDYCARFGCVVKHTRILHSSLSVLLCIFPSLSAWLSSVCTDMERGYVEVPHHSTPELLSVSYRYVKVWGNIHELSSRLETKLLQFLTKYSFQTSIANSYVQASVFSTDRLRNILNLPTRESLHMTVCYMNENSYIEIFQHKLKAEEQYWWKFNQTKTSLPQTGF